MQITIFDILTILGSLALFLYGMKVMSSGLQKLTGGRMRSVLKVFTKTKFKGILTGLGITTIIQSSSATSVMVVGFANAGMLNLTESISLIMGANIGTTVTGWLVAVLGYSFHISSVLLPLFAVGFILFFMGKNRIGSVGEFVMGFAILFLGLEFMNSSIPNLGENVDFLKFIKHLGYYEVWSVLIYVGIGVVVTIIFQSSSAMMALTIVLCSKGWISFDAGAAIILGENIGTTFTANLAAIVGNAHAKRAAFAHTVFNVIGVMWMLLLFNPILALIEQIIVMFNLSSPFTSVATIPIGLALFHSAFNISNVFLLIGFVPGIRKICEYVIRTKENTRDMHQLEFINSGIVSLTETSVLGAKNEIAKFLSRIKKMFGFIPELLTKTEDNDFALLCTRIEKYEQISDKIDIELTNYLIKIQNKDLSDGSVIKVKNFRIISGYIEEIGDVIYEMSSLLKSKRQRKVYFTPEQRGLFGEMYRNIDLLFEKIKKILDQEQQVREECESAKETYKETVALIDKVRSNLFESIERGENNIKSSFYFNKICTSCEKINDLLYNIIRITNN